MNQSIKTIIKEKLDILKDMKIKLTQSERDHLMSLTREIDIDNFCHAIIMRKL